VRLPWPALAGGLVVAALGASGLVRGAMPQSSATGSSTSAPIVVTGAYVRPPLPPAKTAAVYFTVYNTTSKPDRLVGVEAGVGTDAVLHTGGMTPQAGGVLVPAHGRLTLSVGRGHVMIEGVTEPLKAGDQVNIELDFANAGALDVSAPVVPLGRPVPSGASS